MPRKQIHYIYRTTCNITGRYYIGMHSTAKLDDGYLGSGRRLRYSIGKYGRENHSKEILEFLENRQELKDREQQLVNEEVLKDPMCMNLQPGGGGGFCGKLHETACHIGASNWLTKQWEDSNYRKKQSELSSVRMKKFQGDGRINHSTFIGKNHTTQTKDKIGEANAISQRGSKNSQYGTIWVSNESHTKKIKKDQLEQYLLLGWKVGRKLIV